MGGILLNLGLDKLSAKVSDQGVVEVVEVRAGTRNGLRFLFNVHEVAVFRSSILVICLDRRGVDRLVRPLLSSQRIQITIVMSADCLAVIPLSFPSQGLSEFNLERSFSKTLLALLVDQADACAIE